MNRLLLGACLAGATLITACTLGKHSPTNENTNQPAQTAKASPAQSTATQPTQSTQAGELQPGQASGNYSAKGESWK